MDNAYFCPPTLTQENISCISLLIIIGLLVLTVMEVSESLADLDTIKLVVVVIVVQFEVVKLELLFRHVFLLFGGHDVLEVFQDMAGKHQKIIHQSWEPRAFL